MTADVGFLRELVTTPGPSGFEEPVQEVVRRRFAATAAPETDVLGNVVATVNPGGSPRVLIAAHADQLGLQVTWVDEHGFVYFDKLGGVDAMLLPGRAVVVWGREGAVDGVVGKRPTHLIPEAERGKAPEIADQWIDIGARDRAAALARIACGDAVTFAPHFLELGGGVVAGRGLDDRAGVYVVARALELYAAQPGAAELTALSTVQEETRYMGAHVQARRQQPDCVIVIDAEFATDQPEVDPRRASGAADLGGGPTLGRGGGSNPVLVAVVREVAAAEALPVQLKAFSGDTQTDNELLQTAGGGAAALNLGIPVRYMHSPHEVAHLDDLEAAARLIAAAVRRLGESFAAGSFTPRA
ncbi:MAG TPA: M20/M25/M40 family metallo-hydrolase [Thermoleophilia bacterium]|nr:M20/M25/M40 family metallo-hydrolase [Thermoleophilia bacterium]